MSTFTRGVKTVFHLYFFTMNRGGRWSWTAVLLLIGLVVSSCGGGDSDSSEPAEAVAAVTSSPETTVATAAPTTTDELLGPPAPDFTLQLADGGTFALSDQTTPVLMIFWAEW